MKQNKTICIISVLAAMIFSSLTANAEAVSQLAVKQLIVKHSVELGIDPAISLSIAKAESNYMHNRRSRYGAIGVFQLMPATAKRMGFNPYLVKENIKGGITYYKKMYNMFGSMELALAAYNAGPGNVKRYKGVPPFGETRKFVASIMSNYKRLKVNPDPAMKNYEDGIKNINFSDWDIVDESEVAGNNILTADEIVCDYLETQGI